MFAGGLYDEYREPTAEDIKNYLDDSYLVRVLINMNRLNGKKGYTGHAVVVTGYDETGFLFHDPGLPPVENRKEKFADFEAAWASPNKKSKELDALRLTKQY